MNEKLFFKLGFKNSLEKHAIAKKLMGISQFLKSKAVPRLVSGAERLGGEFMKSHGPTLLGGTLGFTAASQLGKNLLKGEELGSEKFTDEFVENLKNFGLFDIGIFGLSKAFGGMKNLAKMLSSKLKGNTKALSKILPKPDLKVIKDSVNTAAKAGKEYALGRPSEQSKSLLEMLPKITLPRAGAAVGAALEYDPDAPGSSLARGAIAGGLAGKGLKAIPKIPGGEGTISGSMLDALQAGLGFEALGYGLERKAKRQKRKELKKYYEQLGQTATNPYYVPGQAFRGI